VLKTFRHSSNIVMVRWACVSSYPCIIPSTFTRKVIPYTYWAFSARFKCKENRWRFILVMFDPFSYTVHGWFYGLSPINKLTYNHTECFIESHLKYNLADLSIFLSNHDHIFD